MNGSILRLIAFSGLKQGVPIGKGLVNNDYVCANSSSTVASKDDRVYVSAVFKDMETENEIGYMEYNHWTLYKGTFLDYHPDPDDRKFEV